MEGQDEPGEDRVQVPQVQARLGQRGVVTKGEAGDLVQVFHFDNGRGRGGKGRGRFAEVGFDAGRRDAGLGEGGQEQAKGVRLHWQVLQGFQK